MRPSHDWLKFADIVKQCEVNGAKEFARLHPVIAIYNISNLFDIKQCGQYYTYDRNIDHEAFRKIYGKNACQASLKKMLELEIIWEAKQCYIFRTKLNCQDRIP